MKNLVIFSVVLLAFVASGVSIPLASERQIMASPLARGEMARIEKTAPDISTRGSYVVGGDYAELYVGGKAGPLRVVDGSALRGYRTRQLDNDEYSVSASSAFTYNPVTGTYTAMGTATNAIIITAKSGIVIDEVKCVVEAIGEGLLPGRAVASPEYDGAVCRLVCFVEDCAGLSVSNIRVFVRDIGEIGWLNDLSLVKFMLKDRLGNFDLNDLRTWARDLYNGNRGADWSKYPAYHNVNLDGKAIKFTGDDRMTASLSSKSNLVFQAGRRDAIVISYNDEAPEPAHTAFMISSIDVASGTDAVLEFVCDFADFAADRLGVIVSESLDDAIWLGVPSEDFTVTVDEVSDGFTSGTVTIPNGHQGKHRFYRLVYGAAATDAVSVALHGKVVVKDVLVLKGGDGKFYQINVNGGVISATEVNP